MVSKFQCFGRGSADSMVSRRGGAVFMHFPSQNHDSSKAVCFSQNKCCKTQCFWNTPIKNLSKTTHIGVHVLKTHCKTSLSEAHVLKHATKPMFFQWFHVDFLGCARFCGRGFYCIPNLSFKNRSADSITPHILTFQFVLGRSRIL